MKKLLIFVVSVLFLSTFSLTSFADLGDTSAKETHYVVNVDGKSFVQVPVKSADGVEFVVNIDKAKYDKAVEAMTTYLTQSVKSSVALINQGKAIAEQNKKLFERFKKEYPKEYNKLKAAFTEQYKELAQKAGPEKPEGPYGIYNPKPEEAWTFRALSPMLGSLINQYTSKGYELGEAVELTMADIGEVIPRLFSGFAAAGSHFFTEINQILVGEWLRGPIEGIAAISDPIYNTLDTLIYHTFPGTPIAMTIIDIIIDATLGSAIGFLELPGQISDLLYHPGEGEGFDIMNIILSQIPVVSTLLSIPQFYVENIQDQLNFIEWIEDTIELPATLLINRIEDALTGMGEGKANTPIPLLDPILNAINVIDNIITDFTTQGYIDILNRLAEEGYIDATAVDVQAIPSDIMGTIIDILKSAISAEASVASGFLRGTGSALGGVGSIASSLIDFLVQNVMGNFNTRGGGSNAAIAADELANTATDMAARAIPQLGNISGQITETIRNMLGGLGGNATPATAE